MSDGRGVHIAITGAAGFVGRALARRLSEAGHFQGQPIRRLTLMDLGFGEAARAGVWQLAGDIGDATWLRCALAGQTIDVVFHLASIPGGMAEQDYALARRVNLDATQTLLELGQTQVAQGGAAPTFVFASSIAVFGQMPSLVTDHTPTRPQMTYGAQKLIGEILVDDFSRRGWVDGRAVRIPGVLARPPARTGQLSAFLSDIIRELATGRPFVCPTSPTATTWASSLSCVVEQLMHAATFDVKGIGGHRALTLPAQRFSMAELVDAISTTWAVPGHELVRYEPDERTEQLFGRFPALQTEWAKTAGFVPDASLASLVRDAMVSSAGASAS